MKKLILGLLLAFAVNVTTADTWTDPETGIMWTYSINDGKAVVGSYRDAIPYETTGAITIPSSLGGCPVTSIGDQAFDGCGRLTSVTIPEGVTSIGVCAFRRCYGLTSVTIPEGVTSIGGDAFLWCDGLTSVTIPSSVTSIGSGAFGGCRGLIEVHISDLSAWCKIDFYHSGFTDSEVNPLAFAGHLYLGCREITECVVPDGVTAIGSYAFEGCRGLTSVVIPSSVTNIGSGAFDECSGLTSVTIPSSVTNIGAVAFEGCCRLTSITIPPSVTNIGVCAFRSCSGLKDVYFKGESISGIACPHLMAAMWI